MNRRIVSFSFFFTLVSLSFIPLLSLYGLRVCPVLSIPGFGFGCYYSAAYIVMVNGLNFLFFYLFDSKEWFVRYRLAAYALVYFIATALSLGILQIFLISRHLSTHSRAPEILLFASLLLGVLQAYGLNWAVFNRPSKESFNSVASFTRLWLNQVARTIFPILVVAAILLHFLVSQSFDFNLGSVAPAASHEGFIEQTSLLVLFLLVWLLATFTFHFLSERDHVNRIQSHLTHLNDLDFKYRSPLAGSWGLWTAILQQINSFSKTLGERSRLLKTFSRFVTASVAEDALHRELSQNEGVARELTVVMSDIRDFTSLSEKLDPKKVVLLLNEYFASMLNVLSAYEMSVDKFIGDGILAYVDREEHVSTNSKIENALAVNAALAMITELEKLNPKLSTLGLPPLKIGIGIYRGPLVIGLIGSESKLQHTIIGDTVNRTARIESFCKQLEVQIVISGQVWHSLEEKDKVKFKSFGKKLIPGIEESMELFGGPFSD